MLSFHGYEKLLHLLENFIFKDINIIIIIIQLYYYSYNHTITTIIKVLFKQVERKKARSVGIQCLCPLGSRER